MKEGSYCQYVSSFALCLIMLQ